MLKGLHGSNGLEMIQRTGSERESEAIQYANSTAWALEKQQ